MKVNILLSSNFFNDHCSYSFVFPILRSLNLIKDGGAEIKFFYSYKKNIFDGDNGEPTRVKVRNTDGTYTEFSHQAWRRHA